MRTLGLILIAFVFLVPQSNPVTQQAGKLLASPAVTLKLAVTTVGGATEEQTVTFSKPNFVKIDTPSTLTVTDGKTVWTLDKKSNVYSEAQFSDAWLAKATKTNILWAWSGFFDKDFSSGIASAQKGSTRKIKNVAVTEFAVMCKDKRAFSVQIDDATGLARGVVFATDNAARTTTDVIVFAKEIIIGESALEANAFAFTPPSGAKKAEEIAASAPHYADVSDILFRGCVSCHGADSPKKGVNLSTYQSIMASGTVVAGKASESKMMRLIRTGKMPPGAPMLKEYQDKLAAWIDGGAQE